jgi:hypothetical protein
MPDRFFYGYRAFFLPLKSSFCFKKWDNNPFQNVKHKVYLSQSPIKLLNLYHMNKYDKVKNMIGKTSTKRTITLCSPFASVIMLIITGCCNNPENKDEYPKFTDKSTPEWSYDQPFYVRPADGVKPIKTFDDQIVEYYTTKRLLQIPRPAVGNPRKAPRIAIWETKDGGMCWKKIGYFGLQQQYFPYEVRTDGTFGIRFIGPGIPPSECKPPKPHMNFFVDTVPPEITLFVSPDQDCYYPGQSIHVEWQAHDVNLAPDSVQVCICIDSKSQNLCWTPLNVCYPTFGDVDITIPDDAIDKTIMVRVTARDKAGNIGQAYSCPVNVVYETVTVEPEASTQPCSQPTTKACETQPAGHVLTTMPQTFPSLEK